jgi:hypothetical protein
MGRAGKAPFYLLSVRDYTFNAPKPIYSRDIHRRAEADQKDSSPTARCSVAPIR